MYSFSLNRTLARDSAANPEDTLNVKKSLNRWGFMEEPAYGLDDMPDEPLFQGIKKFQKANGLKVDGVMKPGGETEKAMQQKKSLSPVVKGSQDKSGKDKSKTSPRKRRGIEEGFIDPIFGNPSWQDDVRIQPIDDVKTPVQPKPDSPSSIIKLPIIDDSLPDLVERIRDGVGIGKPNKPEDVRKIEELLGRIRERQGNVGIKSSHGTGEATPDLLFAIQEFQKQNGLKMDGQINPGGETERSLNRRRHPGLPGPKLPVVPPGPGEGVSSECLEVKNELDDIIRKKNEADQIIKRLGSDAYSKSKESLTFGELASIAGTIELGFAGAAYLVGAAAAIKYIAVIGVVTSALGAVADITETANILLLELIGLKKSLEEWKEKSSEYSRDIARLSRKLDKLGC